MVKNMEGKKEFNYGFALLRVIMCFEVVLNHFWKEKATPPRILIPFGLMTSFAVSVFMFLSFFLMKNLFISECTKKKLIRIKRLAFPLFGWAIIYWFIYIILQFKINFDIHFSDLLWQCFTGSSPKLNPPLWFHSILIIITVLFIFIFLCVKEEYGLFIVCLISLLCLVLEYSGINYGIFNSCRYELKWSIGRLIEMIPYATLGFLCSYFMIFEKLRQKRLLSCILFFLFSCFSFYYHTVKPAIGFGYEFDDRIIRAFFVVGFVYFIPFEKLPEKILKFIKFITKYTLGIYCMHWGIGKIIDYLFTKNDLYVNSFVVCIIIYVICFCFSYLISKIRPVRLLVE